MTTRRILALLAVLAMAIAACGGGSDDGGAGGDDGNGGLSGNVAAGAQVYSSTCASCHAQDATGIEGLGKSLVDSELVSTSSESELVAFITVGRPTSDPENTTGIDMPPKGGNPALTEQDLHDVAAYLKSLN